MQRRVWKIVPVEFTELEEDDVFVLSDNGSIYGALDGELLLAKGNPYVDPTFKVDTIMCVPYLEEKTDEADN